MVAGIETLIDEFVRRDASDLYMTVGAHPSIRLAQGIVGIDPDTLTEEDVQAAIKGILPESVLDEFSSTLEYNTAIDWKGVARLRINLFRQQHRTGMVMRRIHTSIPDFETLQLPPIYGDLVMEKRGLILIVGPTGSGKSSSMASMLQYRNTHGNGHIVTLEDPVEYLLEHKNCIITQRDVGIDTYSFGIGLKNTLRQAPDIIVIGEIRDREAMEHAIVFAETGHLCLATLHANNANQAIERIVNFFPEEKHRQVLLNLSLNLRAILSQRLMPNTTGSRSIAIEIMLNQGLIRQLIHDGHVRELKECIEKGRDQGMQSFDQHLIDLCQAGIISEATAFLEADTPSNVRLALKQSEIARRTDLGDHQKKGNF
ncbi:MAG: PilT/PilU family type 4a pilus ATPase [Alphaproteobacteria bacterium]|nr:PilT/PilU family type 4a pilus ATPase [Alphaproteobacteria bacterium]